jgi:hypothetical protein
VRERLAQLLAPLEDLAARCPPKAVLAPMLAS